MTDTAKVKDSDVVKVHYKGTLNDGAIFDSSYDREPLEFTVGEGQMIRGFENAVRGMALNEKKTVTIPANEAYGEADPTQIHKVMKSQLPPEIQPHVGQKLMSQSQSGQQMVVTVAEVAEDHIMIDTNHPLAGQDLTFEIEVTAIN